MEAKMELARLIVGRFPFRGRRARAPRRSSLAWCGSKEVPADIATVPLPEGVRTDSGIRVDKLLAKIGLAESVSDAVRKIKAGAVEINGERVAGPGCYAGCNRRTGDRASGQEAGARSSCDRTHEMLAFRDNSSLSRRLHPRAQTARRR